MSPTWHIRFYYYFFLSPTFFQIQDGSWHQSRFFFHTQDSRQLPIVDIQEFPKSQPSSQQYIEIGPVCFFWHQRCCHVTCVHELLKCKAEKWLPTKEQASDFGNVNGTWQSYKCPMEGRSAWKSPISVEDPVIGIFCQQLLVKQCGGCLSTDL